MPIPERVQQLCREQPKFREILIFIVNYAHRFEGDTTVGFKMEQVQSCTYNDMNLLMKSGIVQWVRDKMWFTLACPLNELECALNSMETSTAEDMSMMAVSDEAVTGYLELLQTAGDMVDYWAHQINPKIEGMIEVKRAILLCLASHGDEYGDRGRVHVLMYGDPGSAKSALASWVHYHLDAEFCSQRTSQVGLTGDGRGDEVTPGALPRAHKRTLCVDEMDKFGNKDRQGVLEAMEEGKVHIDVGKHSVTLDAECRLIACANRIDEFSPELMDRFDFKFDMKKPTGDAEKLVVSSILKTWFRNKPGYNGIDLKGYLAWTRDFKPDMGDSARERADVLMHMLIDFDESSAGSVRRRESVIRVAYTIAKLNRRNVEIDDFLRSIRILHPTMGERKLEAMKVMTERFVETQKKLNGSA